jgi:hypothetical protein
MSEFADIEKETIKSGVSVQHDGPEAMTRHENVSNRS